MKENKKVAIIVGISLGVLAVVSFFTYQYFEKDDDVTTSTKVVYTHRPIDFQEYEVVEGHLAEDYFNEEGIDQLDFKELVKEVEKKSEGEMITKQFFVDEFEKIKSEKMKAQQQKKDDKGSEDLINGSKK